ncbi:hypothetical protein BCY91_15280 [Pelobium manganitolerans]|uniref:DUF3037 domain-containing protein n=1 Tax=Pelobium manganitolerans TaxID=1842495 RepID=A0A419SA14_9SPHI|nr:DUF3037 domain-containing protein [Pelobium manganitolerans]RKD18692.1 hypothetical protein BCY91_15280 [Pelobium manganitolerans]
MQEQNLFEYAVIRVVPRVEREEFFNVGVVLFCQKKRFLDALFYLDEHKLRAFCKEIDPEVLQEHLSAFKEICCGTPSKSPIASLDAASRFRWLTATRSTVLQSSKVHPGFCENPQQKLQQLFEQMVK